MFHFILLTLLYVANTTESTDTEQIRRIGEAERNDEAEAEPIEEVERIEEAEGIEESKKFVEYCNTMRYPLPWMIPPDYRQYFQADARIILCPTGDYEGPSVDLQRCSDGDVHLIPYGQCHRIDVSGANWTETALIPPGTHSWNHTIEFRYCADNFNQLENVFEDGDTVKLPFPTHWYGSSFCDPRQSTSSTTTTTTSTTAIIPSLTTTTTTSTIEHGSPIVPVIIVGGLVLVCCVGACCCFRRQVTRAWQGCQERLQRNCALREGLQEPPVDLEAPQN